MIAVFENAMIAPPPPARIMCRYINEYPTGRLLRDAKLYEIGAGTSEIRRALIGRELVREASGGRRE